MCDEQTPKVGTHKDAKNVTRLRPSRPCPICKKKSEQAYYPFCSVRCANVDLNHWLKGSYVIPTTDEEQEEAQANFDESDV